MILYKRNAQGKPIFWEITNVNSVIKIKYGLVGKIGRCETFNTNRPIEAEIKSQIAAKRKDGYKELKDIYDNSPVIIEDTKFLSSYLNTYLPKNNTDENGAFIPMLCKTLEDNKPFTKGSYFGEWKINGERCIITAIRYNDLFNTIKLKYRSRKGIDWTDKLDYLDEFLIPAIPNIILNMMVEEGVALDGELYIPGYTINDINSFIKNTEVPQHYQLQFWLYDLAIDEMSAAIRYECLRNNFNKYLIDFTTKNEHLNNKERLILLPAVDINNIVEATAKRDNFIDLGFEGLVIRNKSSNYQFGGKRNSAMLKYKKIEDGKFIIVDIVPEGIKRKDLPKFICLNDINDTLFECSINKPQDVQREILINRQQYIGKHLIVEYRERSGVSQVPFHARGIDIEN